MVINEFDIPLRIPSSSIWCFGSPFNGRVRVCWDFWTNCTNKVLKYWNLLIRRSDRAVARGSEFEEPGEQMEQCRMLISWLNERREVAEKSGAERNRSGSEFCQTDRAMIQPLALCFLWSLLSSHPESQCRLASLPEFTVDVPCRNNWSGVERLFKDPQNSERRYVQKINVDYPNSRDFVNNYNPPLMAIFFINILSLFNNLYIFF